MNWFGSTPKTMSVSGKVKPGRNVLTKKIPKNMAFRACRVVLEGDLAQLFFEDVLVGEFKQFTRESHPVMDLFMGPPKPLHIEASVLDGSIKTSLKLDTALPGTSLSIVLHNHGDGPVFVRVRYIGESMKV